ncbi:MAG TPA: folylpolyglutamate synthase/dihydrofolate synthase family protein [Magnetospirillaceae bacterium]|nr:folylpolyglutamate synthase/dihydrofolate synthase family protein [Magnetospirillaceae bacterium]
MVTKPTDQILERLKNLHPKVIDLALDRVLDLLAALDDPHLSLPPTIHIAGTNGKGSTLAYLRAMAEADGRTTHVYISPHLVRFSERITVASREIGEDALADLLEECERRNEGSPITFFEITTAAAFLAFARTKADLCLLETGLGGRYDATNVLNKPAASLIASISLDHQAFLGDTIAQIAGEKAGIIKPGVPVLSVAQVPEAMAVIQAEAAFRGAPLLVEEKDWHIEPRGEGLRFSMGSKDYDLPRPSLPGRHQWHNAGLAAAAALTVGGGLDLAEGLRTARWPARLQRLTRGPLVDLLPEGWELWLDGGHNPGAGEMLADHIIRQWSDKPLYLAVGMLNTKDSHGFVDPLDGLVAGGAAVAIPGEINSLSADEMARKAKEAGLTLQPASSVAEAIRQLTLNPGPARLLICGSLYLAGTVLADNG